MVAEFTDVVGVLIVAGIALLVLAVGAATLRMASRYTRTRSYIFRRRRLYRRGRIGRIT